MRADVQIGNRFGRWIIIELFYKRIGRNNILYSKCMCDCGNIRDVQVYSLKTGLSQSCGCLQKEICSKKSAKHGLCKHRLYKVWRSMMKRCYNKHEKYYNNYGGRGILVSNEFHSPEIFINYCIEIDLKPGLQIDRIDNNKGYERGNLRAATSIEQNNNKRNNRIFTYNGKTLTLKQWSREKECIVSYKRLHARINRHKWNFERALTTPPQK